MTLWNKIGLLAAISGMFMLWNNPPTVLLTIVTIAFILFGSVAFLWDFEKKTTDDESGGK